jgi:hypothetical protein
MLSAAESVHAQVALPSTTNPDTARSRMAVTTVDMPEGFLSLGISR